MSRMEQLNVLREHSKDLLKQLQQEKEAFVRLVDFNEGRVEEAEFQVLTGEDRSSAREASVELSELLADKVSEHKVSPPSLTAEEPERRQESARCSTPSDFIIKGKRIHDNIAQDDEQTGVALFTENHDKDKKQVCPDGSLTECGQLPASTSCHFPPLLGYDWIAGVLEIQDSVIERSDEFFDDLHSFRSHNKKECVHSSRTQFPENASALSVVREEDEPQVNVDTHQCTFSYRINSRLFPIPLHMELCPVCKKHKSSHPHTLTNPALIRVGIPSAAVLPPHKYRAHRRCSFNPSDSLGLPSHCLTGWSNKGQNTRPLPSSLDLRSSVSTKEGFSVPQASNHQMSSVSRLTRHNFPHFSLKKRRPDGTFKPSQSPTF